MSCQAGRLGGSLEGKSRMDHGWITDVVVDGRVWVGGRVTAEREKSTKTAARADGQTDARLFPCSLCPVLEAVGTLGDENRQGCRRCRVQCIIRNVRFITVGIGRNGQVGECSAAGSLSPAMEPAMGPAMGPAGPARALHCYREHGAESESEMRMPGCPYAGRRNRDIEAVDV